MLQQRQRQRRAERECTKGGGGGEKRKRKQETKHRFLGCGGPLLLKIDVQSHLTVRHLVHVKVPVFVVLRACFAIRDLRKEGWRGQVHHPSPNLKLFFHYNRTAALTLKS